MASIRIYCPYFPYPLTEAAWHSMWNQACDLRDLGNHVEIVTWKDSAAEFAKKFGLAEAKLGNIKVTHWAPTETGDSKLRRVLKSLVGPLSPPELLYYPPEQDQRAKLSPVDLEVYHYSFAYAWLRQNRSRGSKVCVHLHNLEYQLFKLRATRETLPNSLIHRRTAGTLKRHELELDPLADEIWHHSPADEATYRSLAGGTLKSRHRSIGPSLQPESYSHRWASPPPITEVYRLGFAGGLDFQPNIESLRWILNNLCPLIAERNKSGKIIEIVHMGKPNSNVQTEAGRYPFVKFLGFVPDPEAWWAQLSFALVPDTTEAGIRVKLLEALASKVPVLANSKAANRLPMKLQESPGLFVSDNSQDWIEKILASPVFEAREKLRKEAYPADLIGKITYAFLADLTK